MAGLLDFLMGGQAQQPQGGGLLGGGMFGGQQQNATANSLPPAPSGFGPMGMMGLGMGMLSTTNPQQSWGAGMQGMMAGAGVDSNNAIRMLNYQSKLQEMRAVEDYIAKQPGLTDAQKAGLRANPSAIGGIVGEQVKPYRTTVSPGGTVFQQDQLGKSGAMFQAPFEPKQGKVMGPDGTTHDTWQQPPQGVPGGQSVVAAPQQNAPALPSGLGPGTVEGLKGTQENYNLEHKTALADSETAKKQKTVNRLMLQQMDGKGFYSGLAVSTNLTIKQALAGLGIDPKAAASMEAFNSLAKESLLSQVRSLGTGFSEGDRKTYEQKVAGADRSDAGNKLLIKIQDEIADRKLDIARQMNQYVAKNLKWDANGQIALDEWQKKNTIEIPASANPQTQQPGQSGRIRVYNPASGKLE